MSERSRGRPPKEEKETPKKEAEKTNLTPEKRHSLKVDSEA